MLVYKLLRHVLQMQSHTPYPSHGLKQNEQMYVYALIEHISVATAPSLITYCCRTKDTALTIEQCLLSNCVNLLLFTSHKHTVLKSLCSVTQKTKFSLNVVCLFSSYTILSWHELMIHRKIPEKFESIQSIRFASSNNENQLILSFNRNFDILNLVSYSSQSAGVLLP